ncbi:hypothetical protein [Cryptosporangium arvum]|uniref:hypothetical protein n=1 Tax=Cryptosporangium arvum TaxID=80871 RepID=UPI0004AF3645|nr:hypothetical protein [Cryptosporangium arvum]
MTATARATPEHRLTLHRARSAAYVGDLETASALLAELDPGGDGPHPGEPGADAFDLRARVRAQRGEYGAADEDWARVLALRPGDPDAVAGRATLARLAAGRRVRPVYTPARAVALLAAALLVASTTAVVWVGTDRGEATGDPAAAGLRREVATLRAERDARAAAEARQREAGAAAAARHRERLTAVASAFAGLPGVRVEQRSADVRLVFTSGVFASSTELTPAAGPVLAAVGRRLRTLEVVTTVVGHTVAVPGGRTSGGSVVGYGRAQVAARELAVASGRPLAQFALVSAEQSEGPFPDARRNRTVTILLRPE